MSENRRRTFECISNPASVNRRKQRLEMLQSVTRALILSGETLTVEDVVCIARGTTKVFLSPQARIRIKQSRLIAEKAAARGVAIYGMNTQLGPFAGRSLSQEEMEEFQIDTVLGHSVLHGDQLESDSVRAMMLTRINGFAKGTSGIKIETVDALLD
ncbi:MAG: aromatic amino acid lyase, partial [Terriglobales bacterium]